MSRKSQSAWRVWVKALGEKASESDSESDRVALIRTLIFTTYLTTNLFIVAGVVRHWDDGRQSRPTGQPVKELAQGLRSSPPTVIEW